MKNKTLHQFPDLLLAIFICLSTSCQTPTVPGELRISPKTISQYLVRGETKSSEIYEWLGPPKKRQQIDQHDVWIYEWVETSERSAYYGAKIGEEREIFNKVPGYTHMVTVKTLVTLIFNEKGILNNYQVVNQ